MDSERLAGSLIRPNDLVSPHFAAWEFTVSQTAARRGIPNDPSPEQWANLEVLAREILEPARLAIGPIRILSGFRCPELNAAVGGSPKSQHLDGCAADVVPSGPGRTLFDLFAWLHDQAPFGQLIWEFGSWVHVSCAVKDKLCGVVLAASRVPGRGVVYVEITKEQIEAQCLAGRAA